MRRLELFLSSNLRNGSRSQRIVARAEVEAEILAEIERGLHEESARELATLQKGID